MRHTIDSPIGTITIIAEDGAITGIYFGDTFSHVPLGNNTVLDLCKKELDSYFAGNLQEFTVPINPIGTSFRQQVWKALLQIPYGKTASYRDIAVRIENPKSVRAVGGANHNNPISIIIPCHRVIGANGSLTGYGGGLDAKKWLLELEEKHSLLQY